MRRKEKMYINYNNKKLKTLKNKTVFDLQEKIKFWTVVNLCLAKKSMEYIYKYEELLDFLFEYSLGNIYFLDFNIHYRGMLEQVLGELYCIGLEKGWLK